MKKIYIITGHYGCGKTSLSVELAFEMNRRGYKTAIADVDIVNPYFRTADYRKQLEKSGISVYSTLYAGTNLDIPAVTLDLEAVISGHDAVILDVGGDAAGAAVLGRFHDVIRRYEDIAEMIYVINRYRETGADADEALALMHEIEYASGIRHTGIVNNSNIGNVTTAEDIMASLEFADKVSALSGLPVLCHTADKRLKCRQLDGLVKYIF